VFLIKAVGLDEIYQVLFLGARGRREVETFSEKTYGIKLRVK